MAGKKAAEVLSEDDDDQVATQEETVEVEEEKKKQEEPEVEVVEDERIAHAEETEEEEPKVAEKEKQRQKESAKERRERAKAAKERDKREIRFQAAELRRLEQRIAELDKKNSETQVSVLDTRLADALNEVQQFETIETNATLANDPAAAIQARRLAAEAKKRAEGLANEKKQMQERPVQNGPDPLQERFKSIFLQRHPWYNPASGDVDSAIVMALDQQVALAGFRPNTPEYWQELESRVAEKVKRQAPSEEADDDVPEEDEAPPPPPVKRGPPVGGNKSPGNSNGGTTIRLSPERVQALKLAGLWDNPKDRARMAKKYAEHDRNHRANQ